MDIRILGSAAGGGVPQWNCNCPNCHAARISRRHELLRRTQSSLAIRAKGRRWLLLNASPDLCSQFARFPSLTPRGGALRDTAVQAIILTDAELDHVTGLLSLREHEELHLICTPAVKQLITEYFPVLPVLEQCCTIKVRHLPAQIAGVRVEAIPISNNPPRYAREYHRPGLVVGLRLETNKPKRVVTYLPCLPAVSGKVSEFVCDSDCLLLDGTFWSNDEMTSRGFSTRTAREMGHVPISGKDGSLVWLSGLNVPRKIYLHINNTNPVLRKNSPERKTVERAGVEIAHDGMEIRV
jgi:pyrroloquinoline quinone biosynthesis protein B